MDALEEQDFQAELFKENDIILIHCCDLDYVFSFNIKSLPFLRLKGCFVHLSFHEFPSKRRACILPLSETLLQKLHNVRSPCVVRVKSSVIFKIQRDEVELEIDQKVLLIWNFEVLQGPAPFLCHQETYDEEDMHFAPVVDINTCDCNCSRFPNTAFIFKNNDDLLEEWSSEGEGSSSQEDNDEDYIGDTDNSGTEENQTADEAVEEVTHQLPFKCIGAAHERKRQEELEKAHNVLHEQKENVQVKLRHEPCNIKDSKAIAIDMDYGSGWVHVGYIASELTQFIHPILQTGDILNVSVQHILFRVYFLKIGFYPKILITRKGTWDRFVIRKSRGVQ